MLKENARNRTLGLALAGLCAAAATGGTPPNWVAHRVNNATLPQTPINERGQRTNESTSPLWVAGAPNCGHTQVTLNVLSNGPYTDWGDIAFDSTVEHITITYGTTVPDEGEPGVPGYGLSLFFFDGVNGTQGDPNLVTVVHVMGLPGADPHPPILPSVYELNIDLTGDFGAQSFELGDTDGKTFTGHFNPFGGVDLDGDGLHDFAYAVEFSTPDGLPGETFIPLSGPESDPPSAAQGVEPDLIGPDGLVRHGGDCESSDSDPFLQIAIALGTLGQDRQCNEADLVRPFGVLNFFDVAAFLQFFSEQDPRADLASPEGVFDFFDVAAFLDAFSEGCP